MEQSYRKLILVKKIKNLFGDEYANEANIVSKIVAKHWSMITSCGSSPVSFAKFCKEEIEKHYDKFPEESFSGIFFDSEYMGNDNVVFTPKFKYLRKEEII